jgi:hypothetical protein
MHTKAERRYFYAQLAMIAHRRAHEGAEFLDDADPMWPKKIKRAIIMEHTGQCVLGQIFGRYQHGLEALDIDRTQARNLGFLGCRYETRFRTALMYYYSALSAAWNMEHETRIQ